MEWLIPIVIFGFVIQKWLYWAWLIVTERESEPAVN